MADTRSVSATVTVGTLRYVHALHSDCAQKRYVLRAAFPTVEAFASAAFAGSEEDVAVELSRTFELPVTRALLTALATAPLRVQLALESAPGDALCLWSVDLRALVLQAETQVADCFVATGPAGETLDPSPDLQVTVSLSDWLLDIDEAEASNVVTVSGIALASLPPAFAPTDTETAAQFPFVYSLQADALPEAIGLSLSCDKSTGLRVVATAAAPSVELTFAPSGGASSALLDAAGVEALRQLVRDGSAVHFAVARTCAEAGQVDVNAGLYAAECEATLAGLDAVDCTEIVVSAPLRHTCGEAFTPEATKAKLPHRLQQPEPVAAGAPLPYAAAGTLLRFTVSTARPLNARPKTPRKIPLPAELIPARARLPRILPPEDAADDVRQQLKDAVGAILRNVADLFGAPRSSGGLNGDEMRQLREFMEERGHYAEVKERIRAAVGRLFRERVQSMQTRAQKDEADVQHAELYSLVADLQSEVLSQVFGADDDDPFRAPSEAVDELALLRSLAEEAELLGRTERAERYLLERTRLDRTNVSVWSDLAQHCLRANSFDRAEECFREALAFDSRHDASLLGYGALQLERGDADRAFPFLHAVQRDSGAVPASAGAVLCLLAFAAEQQGLDSDARRFLKQALDGAGHGAVWAECAAYTMSLHLFSLCERALARWEAADGAAGGAMLAQSRARMYLLRNDVSRAEDAARESLRLKESSAEGWRVLGEALRLAGRAADALAAYAKAERLDANGLGFGDLQFVGSAHLSAGAQREALVAFTRMAEAHPCATTFANLGRLYAATGKLREAEDALAEANVRNPYDPDVWGQLCELCLQQKRTDEAVHAFQQAVHFGLADARLVTRIGVAWRSMSAVKQAIVCLRRAVELAASGDEEVEARRFLGDAYLTQSEFENAAEQFEHVVAMDGMDGNEHRAYCARSLGSVLQRLQQPSAVLSK